MLRNPGMSNVSKMCFPNLQHTSISEMWKCEIKKLCQITFLIIYYKSTASPNHHLPTHNNKAGSMSILIKPSQPPPNKARSMSIWIIPIAPTTVQPGCSQCYHTIFPRLIPGPRLIPRLVQFLGVYTTLIVIIPRLE